VSRSQYGPAAGTRQGATPKLSLINPPDVLALRRDEMEALRKLSDYTTRGFYEALCEIADFETGEVHRDANYAELIAFGTPPRPQQGPRRAGPTYEQIRRMLRDLEAVGLVKRHSEFNAAQGRLLMMLPLRALAAAEWKKTRARRISQQELAQGQKPRKAA
jgi:hypothetical protein